MTGLSIYITAFWVLRFVPVGLGTFVGVLTLFALVLIFAQRKQERRNLFAILATHPVRGILAALAILLVVRFVPYAITPVAPGADMSMHSYVAALIARANGVPSSYRPLLPIDTFGAYAPGFSVVSALLSRLTGVAVARAAYFFDCMIYFLLTPVAYSTFRSRVGQFPALVAALVTTAASKDPQFFFQWGGTPTILAFEFVMVSFPVIEKHVGEKLANSTVPAALLLVGAATTHAVIPYAMVYVVPLTLAWWAYEEGGLSRLRAVFLRGTCLAGACGLFLMPYLVGWNAPLSAGEISWIRNWQHLPQHLPPTHGWFTIPLLAGVFAKAFGLLFVFWVFLAVLRRRFSSVFRPPDMVFALGVFLIIMNAFLWWLPASYALYPDRVRLLFLLPAGFLIADLVCQAREIGEPANDRASSPRAAVVSVRPMVLLGAAVLSSILPLTYWYVWGGTRQVSVTSDDLSAIEWIKRNSGPTAVIANNYSDAGLWIPAIAFRAITNPHEHIIYRDEVVAWRKTVQANLVFVGEHRVYPGFEYSIQSLQSQPDRYREVFRAGGAAVFRVVVRSKQSHSSFPERAP